MVTDVWSPQKQVVSWRYTDRHVTAVTMDMHLCSVSLDFSDGKCRGGEVAEWLTPALAGHCS